MEKVIAASINQKQPAIILGSPDMGAAAVYDSKTNTIILNPLFNGKRASYGFLAEQYLFELHNAATQIEASKIKGAAMADEIEKEEFVRQVLALEYRNAKATAAAVNEAKQRWGAGREYNSRFEEMTKRARTAAEFYTKEVEEFTKENYRRIYDQLRARSENPSDFPDP